MGEYNGVHGEKVIIYPRDGYVAMAGFAGRPNLKRLTFYLKLVNIILHETTYIYNLCDGSYLDIVFSFENTDFK